MNELVAAGLGLASQRLSVISQLVENGYEHIWDCCCDHGLLGLALMRQHSAKVHFVDIESHLIAALKCKLEAGSAPAERWQTHAQDVFELELGSGPRQLLIISGVGGDSCVAMVKSLLQRYPQQAFDFLLCPVRQNEFVRASLAPYLGLVAERLVEERGRFYEVLLLRPGAAEPLSATAQHFWDFDSAAHWQYLQARMEYLSKKQRSTNCTTALALRAYESINLRFRSTSDSFY